MDCFYCTNYLRHLKLCSLALTVNAVEICPEYTEEPPEEPGLLELLTCIGRDKSFKDIPRWVIGFLSKDYFLATVAGWVFFRYPKHINTLLKYKEVILKHKNVTLHRVITTNRDEEGNKVTLIAVSNKAERLPLLITRCKDFVCYTNSF